MRIGQEEPTGEQKEKVEDVVKKLRDFVRGPEEEQKHPDTVLEAIGDIKPSNPRGQLKIDFNRAGLRDEQVEIIRDMIAPMGEKIVEAINAFILINKIQLDNAQKKADNDKRMTYERKNSEAPPKDPAAGPQAA